MAYSEIDVTECGISYYFTATGGTRRQRGAAIAAEVRKRPGITRMWVNYSESYGFQTATYTRYRKPVG